MDRAKNERIALILQTLRELRAELEEGAAMERLKVIEKELLQLDAELRPRRETS